ncbi:hypothetical protein MJO28_001361 [Puccinia striiformis f. sp. tritici]|nr:hypothetical protein MJO28_001361 [Puccinia striiformis f. sp. tritici]
MKANPTENHVYYYNCIGTEMHFSSCCSSGSIGYPPDTNVMTLNGAGAYKAICVDAKALDSELGSPKDCR